MKNFKKEVLKEVPKAYVFFDERYYNILDPGAYVMIGLGETEEEAWEDAYKYLKMEE